MDVTLHLNLHIKIIFCKDKVELLITYEDKEVICPELDELFYEAYEELDF